MYALAVDDMNETTCHWLLGGAGGLIILLIGAYARLAWKYIEMRLDKSEKSDKLDKISNIVEALHETRNG